MSRRDRRRTVEAAADPPLLGYIVTTAPDPIQVSTASAPATAVISAGVAPLGGQPVYCNQITIYVSVGTDEQALSADQPTSGVNRSSWAPSESDIKSAEALGLPGTADDNYYYATYGCGVTADFDIDYPLIFTLQATVNTVPGPFTLNFEETSALTKDPSSFAARDTAVPMTKADSVFYLDNFIATVAGTPAVPATEFANGAANRIVFSWAGNGTGYTLFAGMPATQIYTGQAKTFTLPAGASVDTTYTLQAEQVSGGAPPEFLYRSLTLTVSNPDLTPNSAVVGPNAQDYPAVFDVQNGWARIGCFNTADVPQPSDLGGMVVGWNRSQGGAETNLYNVFQEAQKSFVFSQIGSGGGPTDLLTIWGNGNVDIHNGGVTIAGALFAGAITGSGALSAASAKIDGALAVGAGPVAMLGGYTPLPPGKYKANSDGFLIVSPSIIPGGGNVAFSVEVAGQSFQCAAGSLNFGSPDVFFKVSGNTTLPVPAGSTFILPLLKGPFPFPQYTAYWVAFGTSAAAPTLQPFGPVAEGSHE
ncbi:MAG: hypothetical protein ACXW2K_16430 [Allosphingosinicella sp.]